MLIDKIIKIKIGTKNYNYYKNLNYNCNVGDFIDINVVELLPNSKTKVNVQCDMCDNIKQIEYRSYLKNIKIYPTYCCSSSCSKTKEYKTKYEIYGDNYEIERVKNMKKTNKIKYGTENTSQLFRNEKDKNIFLEQLTNMYVDLDFSNINYINNYTKVEIICKTHGKFKIRPIELLRGQGCKKCNKEKRKNESLKKYIDICNIIHNNKYDYSKVIFENLTNKVIIICPIHDEFIQSLHLHSENRGCPKCANIERRLKKIELIKNNLKNGYQLAPAFNTKACQIFDDISKQKNIHIQHAMNGGEYYISKLGYWLDGYDIINNIAYEYDEKAHFINGQLKPKDLIRQNEIEKYLKCEFIRIKE